MEAGTWKTRWGGWRVGWGVGSKDEDVAIFLKESCCEVWVSGVDMYLCGLRDLTRFALQLAN